MLIREHVSFAELVTFKVGGLVRYVCTCTSVEDVRSALALAHEKHLPYVVLGEGSNVLPYDDGYEGVVLLMNIGGVSCDAQENNVHVTAGAGVNWDVFVTTVAEQGLWGIENLAGIPGTVGAAPVQNIGAYGAEIRRVLRSVEVLNTETGEIQQMNRDECAFGYRESRFKKDRSLIILNVTFTLETQGIPATGYADLSALVEAGEVLDTPAVIAAAVRRVRSQKFPDLRVWGTAGSFFKNPIVTQEKFAELSNTYGAVPSFAAENGIKIPLAFILDRVLHLRGHREGNVFLFGNQPLVLVADMSATAKEVDLFAEGIALRVKNETGITIEREVQRFP